MKRKLFDPEKSLISLGIFKVVIFIHITVALALSITMIYNSELSPSFSYEGVNFFVEVFRVPLAILALIIPMVALLASNHRSEQTIAQIKSSTSQNTFSNHYKHLEEFEKYCNTLFSEDNKISRPRHLHRIVYSNSQHGSYEIAQSFIDKTEQHITTCLELIRKLNTSEASEWIAALDHLIKKLRTFAVENHVYIKTPATSSQVSFSGVTLHVPEGDIRNILIVFFMQIRILKKAVEFAPSTPFEAVTSKISEVDISQIPKFSVKTPSNFVRVNIEKLLSQQGN